MRYRLYCYYLFNGFLTCIFSDSVSTEDAAFQMFEDWCNDCFDLCDDPTDTYVFLLSWFRKEDGCSGLIKLARVDQGGVVNFL